MARPPGRPRNQPLGVARRAVLDAARSLIATSGYEATTVAAVAQAAGCSRASVYDLMGDKADLFAAVIDDVADEIIAESRTHFATYDGDPDRPLDKAIRDDIRFAIDSIAADPIRLALIREADRHYSEAARRGRRAVEDALAAAYSLRARQFGLERGTSTRLLATTIVGAVEALVMRATTETWPTELVIDWLGHFVLGGILGVESHGLDTIHTLDQQTAT